MYTVTLYNKTNFDSINIPDSPATLAGAAVSTTELPSIDIVQNEHLIYVSVKATREQVEDADYCKIGDFFYSVVNFRMTSPDVAMLKLLADYVTSAGLSNLSAISGTTVRRRVAESEDTFGAFTQPDPLMTPEEPLVLEVGKSIFSDTTSDVTYVESLIDLAKLQTAATSPEGNKLIGRTFYDPVQKDNSVTVPSVDTPDTSTVFKAGTKTLPSTKTNMYVTGKVKEGIGLARSLGVESGITRQVNVPTTFVTSVINSDGSVSSMSGKVQDATSGLNPLYAEVKNKRLLYGDCNIFGLITASGNKAEFSVEDISPDGSVPTITSRADPRPDGKPFFRYTNYRGNTSAEGFFINAISGLDWQNVPLKYTEKSGNILDTFNFGYKRSFQYLNYAMQRNNAKTERNNSAIQFLGGTAGNLINTPLNHIGKVANAGQIGMTNDLLSNGLSYINTSTNQALYMHDMKNAYLLQRDQELANYGYSMAVVAPDINFPLNANLFRDTIGNGVIPYRYRYSANDLARIDKLLTMYGYVDTRAFNISMLSNHKDFDYVELNGITVSADLPRWWREGIKAQLNAGVRVWHKRPTVI